MPLTSVDLADFDQRDIEVDPMATVVHRPYAAGHDSLGVSTAVGPASIPTH